MLDWMQIRHGAPIGKEPHQLCGAPHAVPDLNLVNTCNYEQMSWKSNCWLQHGLLFVMLSDCCDRSTLTQ